MEYSIYKVGGVVLLGKKLLVCKPKGKDFYIAPGGKVETGETPEEALVRELQEEVSITVQKEHLEPFGTFYAPAAGDETQMLRMDVFLVESWEGHIEPGHEIEIVEWVSSVVPENITLGSIFGHDVIPRLKQQKLIE